MDRICAIFLIFILCISLSSYEKPKPREIDDTNATEVFIIFDKQLCINIL